MPSAERRELLAGVVDLAFEFIKPLADVARSICNLSLAGPTMQILKNHSASKRLHERLLTGLEVAVSALRRSVVWQLQLSHFITPGWQFRDMPNLGRLSATRRSKHQFSPAVRAIFQVREASISHTSAASSMATRARAISSAATWPTIESAST